MGASRQNLRGNFYGVRHDLAPNQRGRLFLGGHDVDKRYDAAMPGMRTPNENARQDGPLHVLPYDAYARSCTGDGPSWRRSEGVDG